MKIRKIKTVETDIEVSVESVGIHFDKEGITAMVRMEDAADRDDVEEVLVSWDELDEWAMASSQEAGDCESICAELRKLADKLQAWNEG